MGDGFRQPQSRSLRLLCLAGERFRPRIIRQLRPQRAKLRADLIGLRALCRRVHRRRFKRRSARRRFLKRILCLMERRPRRLKRLRPADALRQLRARRLQRNRRLLVFVPRRPVKHDPLARKRHHGWDRRKGYLLSIRRKPFIKRLRHVKPRRILQKRALGLLRLAPQAVGPLA